MSNQIQLFIGRSLSLMFLPFLNIQIFSGRFAKDRQQLRAMSEEMPSLHGTERTRRTSSKMVRKHKHKHKHNSTWRSS